PAAPPLRGPPAGERPRFPAERDVGLGARRRPGGGRPGLAAGGGREPGPGRRAAPRGTRRPALGALGLGLRAGRRPRRAARAAPGVAPRAPRPPRARPAAAPRRRGRGGRLVRARRAARDRPRAARAHGLSAAATAG